LDRSEKVVSQTGHWLLQNSMPDEEAIVCVQSKRKKINWTPIEWLHSTGHHKGFWTLESWIARLGIRKALRRCHTDA
jgi:hypothetical protein